MVATTEPESQISLHSYQYSGMDPGSLLLFLAWVCWIGRAHILCRHYNEAWESADGGPYFCCGPRALPHHMGHFPSLGRGLRSPDNTKHESCPLQTRRKVLVLMTLDSGVQTTH